MARISIDIKTALDAAGFNQARDGVGKLGETIEKETSRISQRFDAVGRRMSSFGKGLTIGVTAPLVAGLSAATKAAADEQKEMAVLAQTLRNNADATQPAIKATETWITKMQNLTGFADGQLRPALGKLVIAGRSVEQAQADMGVAMDIARARGVDLETVVSAMSKGALGSTTAFSKLGLATKDASGEALTYDQILKEASRTMGGAAAAAAGTAAGKAEILKNKMADAKETIGTALLPVMDKLTSVISSIAERFNALSPHTQDLIVKMALVAAAVGPVLFVGGKAISMFADIGKAFSALSKLLMANPWALLIAATVALVVIVVKNWDTIIGALGAAWKWIQETAGKVFGWLKDLFLNFTPVGQIIKNWDKLKEAAASIWEGIKGVFKGGVNAVIRFLNDSITGVERLINAFARAYNLLTKIPGSPLKPIGDVHLPRIPELASGGNVTKAGWSIVGERGPELLQLPQGASVTPLTNTGAAMTVAPAVMVSSGAIQINVNGSLDRSAIPDVRTAIDEAFGDLLRALYARLH